MRKAAIVLVSFLFVIYSCSKKSAVTAEKKVTAADLFSKNCARCHGPTGTEGRAPNLAKLDISKAEIAETIAKGSGRMPAFADNLSSNEIAALADYVITLRKSN